MTREKRRRILNRILAVVAAVAIFLACRSAYVHFTSPETQPEGPDTTPAGSNDFVQTSPDKPLYVLLIGTDGENPQQANFVGVAAINKDKKHIDLIMLPDDTKIEGRKERGYKNCRTSTPKAASAWCGPSWKTFSTFPFPTTQPLRRNPSPR